jgi:hypothetical protein
MYIALAENPLREPGGKKCSTRIIMQSYTQKKQENQLLGS